MQKNAVPRSFLEPAHALHKSINDNTLSESQNLYEESNVKAVLKVAGEYKAVGLSPASTSATTCTGNILRIISGFGQRSEQKMNSTRKIDKQELRNETMHSIGITKGLIIYRTGGSDNLKVKASTVPYVSVILQIPYMLQEGVERAKLEVGKG